MYESSTEVTQAGKNGQPLVALESTIITHGMPYPENLSTTISVQNVIREQGAVPATIAVLDGKLKVGLEPAELEYLARAANCLKLSRADLAFAMSSGATGSTTVAATMIAANLADIAYFATGGIGGVHRGAQATMDISADLNELARTNVCVVCAGAKAILDIPLTLEYLETAGVPVLAFGQQEIPAFWSRSSGIAATLTCSTPSEITAFIETRRKIGATGGVLVANPIPASAEIPRSVIDEYIRLALRKADQKGISGKAVTPYLLSEINTLSGGKSLSSNIALIKNNANLAARLAVDADGMNS